MSIPTPFNPLGTLGELPLPPGYRRLKCIVFTNEGIESGQYLNTGLKVDAQTKWELDVAYLENSNSSYNGHVGGNSLFRCHMQYSNSKQEAQIGIGVTYGDGESLKVPVAIGQRITQIIDCPNCVCKIGDTEKAFEPIGAAVSAHINIGRRNSSGYYYAHEKVYRSRIWKGGALVQDLVPALDADGQPCFYDLAGTGDAEARTYRNLGIGTLGYES